jgi:hypothetical protein
MGVMAVLMLPLLLLGISGLLFIYQEVSRLWSKSTVQNKVVVITDAISGLGKGKLASPRSVPISAPSDMQSHLSGGEGVNTVFSPSLFHYSTCFPSLGWEEG